METQAKTRVEEKKTKKLKVSGAEAIVLSLIEEGVDTLFGYVGGAIMPVYDVLYDYQDKLKHVMVRMGLCGYLGTAVAILWQRNATRLEQRRQPCRRET